MRNFEKDSDEELLVSIKEWEEFVKNGEIIANNLNLNPTRRKLNEYLLKEARYVLSLLKEEQEIRKMTIKES